MTMVVTRQPLKTILWWTQRFLFAAAAVTLSYCAFVLADAWMFQRSASRELERRLIAERTVVRGTPRTESPTSVVVGEDGLIGRIAIPRLRLSAIIAEGTSVATLRHAVGHIARTGLPGQAGNIGLAAHRDTFFRPLKDIQQNDMITLTTLAGEYRYRVVSTRIVVPTEVSVLRPDGNEVLTLVTCYPFYFVGPAPDRFIVRAERVL